MGQPMLPLIVEAEELDPQLGRDGLLVVDLSDDADHWAHHVAGAVHLDYARIVHPLPPAMGMMPPDDELGEVLGSVGISPETHVVAYDATGSGRASRLVWTLDAIGHGRASLVNGGLQAWLAAGLPTEAGIGERHPVAYAVPGHTEAEADKAYIFAHLGDPDVVLLDVRSPAEFAGADLRAARGGHIPGAANLDWACTTDPGRELRFKPDAALRAMLEPLGVTPEKEIITYCQTHHRSAHTYTMLKALGYARIRGYAGSWSEWGNDPDVPIET